MDLKKIVLGGVLGGLAPFILSGVWHLGLMKDVYYTAASVNVARPEPILPLIFLSYLVIALVMAYLYPFGYQGGSPVKEGLRFGIPFGLILGLGVNVGEVGIFQFIQTPVFWSEVFWRLVEMAVAGVIIAWVYGPKGSSKKARRK